ncbi:MAG: hypothetical protein H8E66_24230 [Planctomycetes bacterium]|nr:hypothetical protein [Planctomycetota bacterium]
MIDSTNHDLAAGERRRDDAHTLLEARRDIIVRRGRRALLNALLEYGRATADDVRTGVELPDGIDPVCLGAVPGVLARTGIIERDGYVATRRADAHARPVSVWRLRDRAAAEQWLTLHPDLPDITLADELPLWRCVAQK